VASAGAYVILAFCSSFWDPEVFLIDMFRLAKYCMEDFRVSNKSYVIIPLFGWSPIGALQE